MKLDIIGDIHGCLDEFIALTKKLGYSWDSGIPIHSAGRKLAFIGDLTDRGPDSTGVVSAIYRLFKEDTCYYVPGNHCNKLYRYLKGNKVQILHGLETTVDELDRMSPSARRQWTNQFNELYESAPYYASLDDGRLVLAHAGIQERDIGQLSKRIISFVLYGDVTGQTNEQGLPVRRDWASSYAGRPLIVYGHTPVHSPRFLNNTINIDTGAVFGNELTALRYPEIETVSVRSNMPYRQDKFRDADYE